ncbi:MAX dimerization protein MGA a isoform 2-T2 [Anableps anableps]
MASTKTCQGMVILKEGATAPAAAPMADHSPACLVALRPGKVQNIGTVQGTGLSSGEAKISGKHKMYPAKEAIMNMGELKQPTSLNSPSDVLSPDCVCKDVKVTLDNNGMWNEFYKCRTEMILTKQGSRMFPYCRFRIAGLQSSGKYSLVMDIEPLDNSQYKWTGESWQVCRKAECHVRSKPFIHPDSPATGQHWMQSPVSFYRLKLTNNISDQEGNIILHPMHRYLPQLHLVQADRAVEDFRLSGPNVLTFTFPQTEFITVTTYQNPQFTQLKVNYNPFVKKLKEDRINSCDLKFKGNVGKELNSFEGKTNAEQHPVKKSLKILLANHKPRNSKATDLKLPAPKEPQEKSTETNTQSAATVPVENPSSSHLVPKLISELICEAHVSLQRCHMEQRDNNHSNSPGVAQSNTTSTTTADKLTKQNIVHKNNGSVTTSTRKSSAVETTRNITDNEHLSNSSNYIADVRTVCSSATAEEGKVSLNKSHQQCKVGAEPDGMKQQKRPVRLPLPALALFLKQHSTKSKKAKNKLDSDPQASLPESCGFPSPAAARQQKTSVKPTQEDRGGNDVLPDEKVLNVAEQAVDMNLQPSSPSGPDLLTASDTVGPKNKNSFISVSDCLGSGSIVPDHKALMSNSENTLDSLEISTLTLSKCSTSASPDLSLHLTTPLSLPNSPKPAAAESSTLPPGSRSMKIDSVLPDPQCSSFDFDPLSPASSPEPLPPLPASLALELDSATSSATSTADAQLSRSSSVFKWHTVLPLSGTYTDSSFTALQPQQQLTPVMSVAPPLLSCLPEPQSVNTSTPTPPKDPIPSFQDSEQSLPFPAELSPLALQLPLSPTFSSLDEDGLSPTASLSELVHFFSTNDDIGVEFSNTDTAAVPIQPLPVSEPARPSVPVQPVSTSKPCKRKKSTKLARLEVGHGGNEYRSKQPKVEEVEEQLFVSFTSKEALKLHTAESSEELVPDPQLTPDPNPTEEAEDSSRESLEETIGVHEETLLRDLKLMKHRQVIHPVLQEVGLKMTLLDPALSIDLQYLGVSLPIPPPGVVTEPLTPTVPTSQGVFASFQSRTGKTTDMTQIKGWKEKFTPSEAEPTAALKPEAGPSADLLKKNLSAFCSDMLDEYLESEGKLIDERASSFSQPPVEAPAYQLPVSSTSYVRTLDHILKKPTAGSPASDIISGFIPPSQRSRFKGTTTCRRVEKKPRGPKQNRIKSAFAPPEFIAAAQMQDAVPGSVPGGLPHIIEPLNEPTFKRRRRLKPRASSQTLGASMPLNMSEDMAPLESDSELKPDSAQKQPSDQTVDTQKKEGRVTVTRTFARLKELEDSVVLEGRFQTSVTKERATIALMSLFTQTGFVRENPTAPIKLRQRRALRCLNEFCRLGCVCSSLSHCSRISHCGQPSCMFGCSCLKQKVVLLKNLDTSELSDTSLPSRVKKKRRMMKMAYVLKEADTVAHPAERVRTLWWKNAPTSDPEPVRAPDVAPFLRPPFLQVRRKYPSSCARVRGFIRKTQKEKDESKELTSSRHKAPGQKFLKHGQQTLKQTNVNTPRPHSADAGKAPSPSSPSSSEALQPKPSKRLLILADCKWASDSDRSYVLKKLCEAMAQDQLDKPFWIKNYLITPIDETVDETSENRCIQYRVQISTPILEMKTATATVKPVIHGRKRGIKPAALHRQDNLFELTSKKEKPPKSCKNVMNQSSTDSVEDWQKEVMEEAAMEDWQKEVMEEEPMEDWQKEVMEEPMEDWQKEMMEEPMEFWQKEMMDEPMEDWQKEMMEEPMADWQKEMMEEVEPLEDYQMEVKTKEEPMEDWQKKLKVEMKSLEHCQKEVTEKEELMKDWQKKLKVEPREDFQKEVVSTKDSQKKAESMENFQKEAESMMDCQMEGKSIKDYQKEIREVYKQKDGEGCKGYQARHELKRSTEELNSDNRRRTGMSLPFLMPVSPAGFLLANKKQPGGSEDVIQVNGKRYPLAKMKLGRMGALHPANRLAAYLTGRVGSPRLQRASSSSEPSCKLQSSPHVTSSAFSVPSAPAASTVASTMLQSQLSVTQPTLPTPSADSEPQTVVVGSSNPSLNLTPPTDPQPLLVQVPNPPNVATHLLPPRITQFTGQRMVLKPVRSSTGVKYYRKPDGALVQLIPTNQLIPVNPSATIQGDSEPQNLAVGSSKPSQKLTPPTDPQPLLIQLPNPPKVVNFLRPRITQFSGQRMVLKTVRSSTGIQYYQKPDGGLVQLIPTSQLRPGNPSATIQGDRFASCSQRPPVAVVKRPVLTSLCSSTSSAVHSSVVLPSPSPLAPSSSSSSVNPLLDPLLPPSVLMPQQNTCTFRIVPPHPVKDPIFIQLPYLPPTQVVGSEGVIRLQSPSQTVSYTPPNPPVCEKTGLVGKSVAVAEDIPVEHQSDSTQTQPTVQMPTETAIPRVPSTPALSPPREPTPDCPSPKQEFAFDPVDLDIVCVDGTEVVDLVSSSETEDSSDFSEDEKQPIKLKSSKEDLGKKKKRLKSLDENWSILAPSAAGQTDAARKEVNCLIYISSGEDSPNKKTVTNGAAAAGEVTGDRQLGTSQEEAWSGTLENLEGSRGCGASPHMLETRSRSDMDTEVDSGTSLSARLVSQHYEHNASRRKQTAQMNQLFLELKKEVLPTNDCMSKTSLLEKAVKLIQELRSSEEDLKRKKNSLVKRRNEYLSILAPSPVGAAAAGEVTGDRQLGTSQEEAWSGTLENLEGSRGCGASPHMLETRSRSDMDTEVDSGTSLSARLVSQAPKEVQKLPSEMESLSFIPSLKKEDNRDTHIEDVCSTSGAENLQHLLTSQPNQKQPEMENRQQIASDVPVGGVLCVALPTGDADPLQTPLAPPCLPTAVQLQPLRQPVLHKSDCASPLPTGFCGASGMTKRTKTVPNILSRSRSRAQPLKTSAEEAPDLDGVLFTAPPGGRPHRTQELQPLLAAAPPAFLLLSSDPNQVGVHPQGPAQQPLSPAASQSSAPSCDHHSDVRQSEPAGQEARQDSDNESLSSLLNEIVFLNQRAVATATTAGGPPAVMDRLQDSSVVERKQASEHPGLISGNANEGVLTPPPLLHMKVGGAKGAGLGPSDGAAVRGGGSGGVAWRPMPRLVPLGLRGNSPS